MSDRITTFTGVHFDPLTPEIELIRIEDIAHALPMICRGNGHIKTFWSVGQHCIACAHESIARGYSTAVSLACLLHDATEIYLSDVPRPFKKQLSDYRLIEDRLLDLIEQKYIGRVLTEAEHMLVREIDNDLLWYDLTYLLSDPPASPKPSLSAIFSYDFLPFAEVEQEYLSLFHQLTDSLDSQ